MYNVVLVSDIHHIPSIDVYTANSVCLVNSREVQLQFFFSYDKNFQD